MSGSMSPQGMPVPNEPFVGPKGIINRAWFLLLQALWNRTGGAQGGTLTPPGIVADFAGPESAIPAGWLKCGQAVSRASFPNLFAAIGTTWGAGNGSTTFDLPPQGVFAKGLGADAVGATGGSSAISISTAQLPAHNHAVIDPGHTHAVTDPGHVHAITDPGHHHTATTATSTNTAGVATGTAVAGNTGDSATGVTINSAVTGVTNVTASTGVSTQDTGSGSPITILPPYATFLKIIKT